MSKTKETKEPTVNDYSWVKGLAMLAVITSATAAIGIIMLGTGDEIARKIVTAPLAIWVIVELVKRFAK